MPITMCIREQDLRHIRITCRCGEKSIADVPEPLQSALNIHLCPGCRAVFGIQKRGSDWKVRRIEPQDVQGGVAISDDQLRALDEKVKVEGQEEPSEAGKDSDKKNFVN